MLMHVEWGAALLRGVVKQAIDGGCDIVSKPEDKTDASIGYEFFG